MALAPSPASRHDDHVLLALDDELETLAGPRRGRRRAGCAVGRWSQACSRVAATIGSASAYERRWSCLRRAPTRSAAWRRPARHVPACPAGRTRADRASISGQVESDAVILDDQRDLIGPPLENDLDVAGARVLGDVVERFLRDAVERRLDLRCETIGRQAGGVQLGGDVHPHRPVLNVVRERRAQAEVVERGRPQLPDQMIDVAIELLRHLSRAR